VIAHMRTLWTKLREQYNLRLATPCSTTELNGSFGPERCIHLQNWRVSQRGNQICLPREFCSIFVWLTLRPEDGSDIFLQIVGGHLQNHWRDLDWMMGFIALIHSTRNYKIYSAISVMHHLRFTVTSTLGFSVFISRTLETDLVTVIIPASL
jgi:hypothetical protein